MSFDPLALRAIDMELERLYHTIADQLVYLRTLHRDNPVDPDVYEILRTGVTNGGYEAITVLEEKRAKLLASE